MNEYYQLLYDAMSVNNVAMREENVGMGAGVSYFCKAVKGIKWENGEIEFCDLNHGHEKYRRLHENEVIRFYNEYFLSGNVS